MAPASYFAASSPLAPIGTPAHSTQSTSTPIQNGRGQLSDTAELWARLEAIQQADQEKTCLINELIIRYEYLTQEYQRLSSARGPEQDIIRTWQREKQEYEHRLSNLYNTTARNPFVVILIDGDGMIFENEFVREGEAGGRKAAARLQKEIEQHIQYETDSIPLESRVICRMYANVSGLADVLVRTGVIEEVSVFESFVRGFTRGKTLFDFVDVGPGKDRADDKVIESFKLYLNDIHCRQIFFGCSHDNGFARTLEEYMTDSVYLSKVTLLEGVPFEKELLALPYKTKKFLGVFRESKINVLAVANGPQTSVARNYNIISGLPSRLPPPSRAGSSAGLMDSPIFAKVNPALPRTPSSSTLASDGLPAAIKPMNWAEKAAAPPPPVTVTRQISWKCEAAKREEVIARNRVGQRVDPQTRDYDKTEVDRVKKIKMCNVHFLRQECPYGSSCTHLHNYEPTTSEIATLRLVARMAPCINASGCDDIKCIYGHRCPAPRSKKDPAKGTKTCIFGDTCKFSPELHDIDCTVVKTLVIR